MKLGLVPTLFIPPCTSCSLHTHTHTHIHTLYACTTVHIPTHERPPLPPNTHMHIHLHIYTHACTRMQDANGRTFYIDHRNRRTQWERPTAAINQGQVSAQLEAQRRRQMAQTLARRNPGLESSLSHSQSTFSLPTPPHSGRNSPVTTVSEPCPIVLFACAHRTCSCSEFASLQSCV